MEKINEIIRELITELLKMDVDDIESFRKEWIEQLNTAGIGDALIALCDKTCSLVIEQKEGIKYGERKSI